VDEPVLAESDVSTLLAESELVAPLGAVVDGADPPFAFTPGGAWVHDPSCSNGTPLTLPLAANGSPGTVDGSAYTTGAE
jgi:hypothetical protein